MRNFLYFLKEALLSTKRNFGTALGSIITIFLSLFIIGVFLLGGIIVGNVVKSVENEVSIVCYVSDDAMNADVVKVQEWIAGLDEVKSATYVTKEQALERFRDSLSDPEIVDQLANNPLPASIDVELVDPQQVQSVADRILSNDDYLAICYKPDNPQESISYGQDIVERLFAVTNYIRYAGYALIGLLIIVAFVFINNTIRLAVLARRKEIAIMRLVGASNGFIRGPFMTEGALQALFGAVCAIVCLFLVKRVLLTKVSAALAWLPVNIESSQMLLIYLALLVVGLLIGVVGSALAMRRHLQI